MLLAEVLLQRTRADQVAQAYRELYLLAPSPTYLAKASHAQILTRVRALGLPQRVRLIQRMADALVTNYKGRIPATSDLLSLPGVGPYTAHAVGVFARGERHLLLDWTTSRLLTRLFGKSTARRPNVDSGTHSLGLALMGRAEPSVFNRALIDLAAKACRPVPLCHSCPLLSACRYAARTGRRTSGR